MVLEGANRKSLVADTFEDAQKLRDDLLGRLKTHVDRTFGDALDGYLVDQKKRGLSADTIDKINRMMRLFLPLDAPLTSVSAERDEEMYETETQRAKANGEPLAADTHDLLLRRVKHFYKWAVSRRYIDRNPFADVRPIGRPRRGKQQLRIDDVSSTQARLRPSPTLLL